MTGGRPDPSPSWSIVLRVQPRTLDGKPLPDRRPWREWHRCGDGRPDAVCVLADILRSVVKDGDERHVPELCACLDDRPEFRELIFDMVWLEDGVLRPEKEGR